MKFVLIQGDGMSDYPVDSLGGKTPLQAADTPNMDGIAANGTLGLTKTIPDGLPPGTDVGTMSILGYDPARYHTGRSPIEAASMGIDLADDDIAFRCNLVTLAASPDGAVMNDFTAGHVSSEDAAEIINALQDELGDDTVSFHPGVSYRHLMVWHGGSEGMSTTPPHDITDRLVADFVPGGEGSERLLELTAAANKIIAQSPAVKRCAERGEKVATDIWLWGQGRRPTVPTLVERHGLRGGVITAVDVVGGLGRLAGLERIEVPGITGFVDTNFTGKGEYALNALEELDLVFVHVEAPDESGHMGDADLKVQSIEALDKQVIGTILEGIDRYGDWRIMVLPDHATPVSTKTHSADPVPFAIMDSCRRRGGRELYSEAAAASTGLMVEEAHLLLDRFVKGTF